jgi:hypothetical protein
MDIEIYKSVYDLHTTENQKLKKNYLEQILCKVRVFTLCFYENFDKGGLLDSLTKNQNMLETLNQSIKTTIMIKNYYPETHQRF